MNIFDALIQARYMQRSSIYYHDAATKTRATIELGEGGRVCGAIVNGERRKRGDGQIFETLCAHQVDLQFHWSLTPSTVARI